MKRLAKVDTATLAEAAKRLGAALLFGFAVFVMALNHAHAAGVRPQPAEIARLG